ncbi:MAG: hypothetical protein ACP5TE_04675 [Verrucomicrobiia bacterium]
MNGNNRIRAVYIMLMMSCCIAYSARYEDRIVWIFGWGLGSDNDVAEIKKVLKVASQNGFNAAMMSAGLDTLCKQNTNYFRRLGEILQYCKENNLEFIPGVFSVGYGGGALSHNRQLAEGLPVVDAPFGVSGKTAYFQGDDSNLLKNGGFEESRQNNAVGYNFHDQPGVVSFIDNKVFHSGKASLRLENFTANQYGHGRVMQEIKVKPYRCYIVNLWVKTENLQPTGAFNLQVLVQNRSLAPREFNLPTTTDWKKLTMVFNSMEYDKVRVYAGMWGGKTGKLWLDDWEVREIGPINVLRRPGTPVVVKSEEGKIIYEEGRDYEPLVDPEFSLWRWDHKPISTLKLTSSSRIKDGQRLLVSWYHPMVIHDSQVTVCMGEPELYEIYDHEAKLLAQYVKPKRVMLNMDEIRMGGTCKACENKDMAKLLGECVTRQVQALRKYNSDVKVYIWSDMFDPNHNARPNYYLVKGDFSESYKYIPKDITIAVWGGRPREKSLKFFESQGFNMLIACYYDADNLDDVKGWIEIANRTKGVRGFMYTPWQKKYQLLPEFGRLISLP